MGVAPVKAISTLALLNLSQSNRDENSKDLEKDYLISDQKKKKITNRIYKIDKCSENIDAP